MPQTLGGVISNAETRERLTKPAVQGFLKIADLWNLSEPQQLALLGESISRSTLNSWRSKGPKGLLSVDQVQRASLVLGIYEGLQRIFRRAPAEGDVDSPCPFGGTFRWSQPTRIHGSGRHPGTGRSATVRGFRHWRSTQSRVVPLSS